MIDTVFRSKEFTAPRDQIYYRHYLLLTSAGEARLITSSDAQDRAVACLTNSTRCLVGTLTPSAGGHVAELGRAAVGPGPEAAVRPMVRLFVAPDGENLRVQNLAPPDYGEYSGLYAPMPGGAPNDSSKRTPPRGET